MPALTLSPIQEGDILADKYRVERVLGLGGMGVVVAAMHLELDERVAIKFLLEEALDNTEAVERFAREARAAVRIKSEHVARVTDVGKLDSGVPYMVMEYLEGHDLDDELQKRTLLPVEEASDYLLQACEAIAEAHALGIVHRDLKPANLFLSKRADGSPIIKVLDFGISKATRRGSRDELSLTTTSAVMGSPFYMSPEQLRSSRETDTRSDIWALGMILHELVSGRVAFQAQTLPELCVRITSVEIEPITARGSPVPEGLERIIRTCLAKDASDRYPSIAELAAALAPFAPPRSRISVDRIRGVLRRAEGATPSGAVVPIFIKTAISAKNLTAIPPRGESTPGGPRGGGMPAGPKGAGVPAEDAVPPGTIAPWGDGKKRDGHAKNSRPSPILGVALGVVVVAAGVGFLLLRTRAEPPGLAAPEITPSSLPAPIPSTTPLAPPAAGAPAPQAGIPSIPSAAASSAPNTAGVASAEASPIAAASSPKTPRATPKPAVKPAPAAVPAHAPPIPGHGLFDDPK
jgi:serine/threonine protein kinase